MGAKIMALAWGFVQVGGRVAGVRRSNGMALRALTRNVRAGLGSCGNAMEVDGERFRRCGEAEPGFVVSGVVYCWQGAGRVSAMRSVRGTGSAVVTVLFG